MKNNTKTRKNGIKSRNTEVKRVFGNKYRILLTEKQITLLIDILRDYTSREENNDMGSIENALNVLKAISLYKTTGGNRQCHD